MYTQQYSLKIAMSLLFFSRPKLYTAINIYLVGERRPFLARIVGERLPVGNTIFSLQGNASLGLQWFTSVRV